MQYFVYIVECADKTLYTGIAKDVAKRLHAHNHSKAGARYTSTRRPVVLKYLEKHKTIKSAMLREIEIKRWTRPRKIGLINSRPKIKEKKMEFEYPEDEKFFADLFCKGKIRELKKFEDFFDFRNPEEKRKEFGKLRRKLIADLLVAHGADCMLKLSVCLGNRKLEVDHLIPLSSNELNKKIRHMLRPGKNKVTTQSFGSNHPKNLLLACQKCNARKKHLFLQSEIFKRIMEVKLGQNDLGVKPVLGGPPL